VTRIAKLKVEGPHVVIADSDPLARRVIRDALQDGAGFVIPGEASTGPEAVELSLHYRPELTLMEVSLPGMDGVTATRRILAEAPDVRILIFSLHDGEETQLEALHAGASGFLSKNVSVDVVSRVVQRVVDGEAAISRMITMRLIERLRLLPEGGTGMRPVRSPLTPREWEVLDLLCEGRDTKRIAEVLVLSEETIYTHTKNLLRKPDVHSRQEAVEVAQLLRRPIVGLAAEKEHQGNNSDVRALGNA
jgi:two-component system, NarL family, response regulator LiaR